MYFLHSLMSLHYDIYNFLIICTHFKCVILMYNIIHVSNRNKAIEADKREFVFTLTIMSGIRSYRFVKKNYMRDNFNIHTDKSYSSILTYVLWLLSEMDFVGGQYYKLNRTLLLCIGLWPYETSFLRKIQIIFFQALFISILLCQVATNFLFHTYFI